MSRHMGMSKDALQLRAKEKLSLMQAVIKRFDAHAVARQDKAALRLDPESDGEHSAESFEAAVTPMKEGIENYFSVASRMEAIAGSLKLGTQLLLIEDLAVEDESHIAISTSQRLVTAVQVEDS
ncbi:MAG: hypothetical protein DMG61_14645 [Acidobacteria bacterium]|nr:MAG: hypothetical protein DMG61_14645 [Acidobacteriota bacterium]